MTSDLPWLQSDDVGPGCLKDREPHQVWMENIHLAEDTWLFVGDPGRVKVDGVLWRKEVPTLSTHRKHKRAGKDCCKKFIYPLAQTQ